MFLNFYISWSKLGQINKKFKKIYNNQNFYTNKIFFLSQFFISYVLIHEIKNFCIKAKIQKMVLFHMVNCYE